MDYVESIALDRLKKFEISGNSRPIDYVTLNELLETEIVSTEFSHLPRFISDNRSLEDVLANVFLYLGVILMFGVLFAE